MRLVSSGVVVGSIPLLATSFIIANAKFASYKDGSRSFSCVVK